MSLQYHRCISQCRFSNRTEYVFHYILLGFGTLILFLILVCFDVLVAHCFLNIGLFLGFWLTFDWIYLHVGCLFSTLPVCKFIQYDSTIGTI